MLRHQFNSALKLSSSLTCHHMQELLLAQEIALSSFFTDLSSHLTDREVELIDESSYGYRPTVHICT